MDEPALDNCIVSVINLCCVKENIKIKTLKVGTIKMIVTVFNSEISIILK